MREDPVFSGGVVKAVLVLLVAAALGFGAYALVGDGVDIDLPDVDLPDTETDSGVVDLTDTELSDTTIDGPAIADNFTTDALARAVEQISEEAGADAELTRLLVNDVQTQAFVRRGDAAEAYSVRTDTGELVREEATIEISGEATIEDFAFPLEAVQPAAVDRMLDAARDRSGAEDFEPTVLSLERALPFGRRALEWTINAQGGGRSLTYRAGVDGSLRGDGAAGAPLPPEAIDAQRLNECIAGAGNDPDRIFACLDRFQ